MDLRISIAILWIIYVLVVDSGWTGPISGIDSSYDYLSSTWLTDRICIIVGNRDGGGILYKTIDGGLTWVNRFSENSGRLFDVASLGNLVITVSDAGQIYHSIDGFETPPTVYSNLVGVYSLFGAAIGKNGNAFVVGSTISSSAIFTSTTADLSVWTHVTSATAFNILYDVTSFDGINVIAVGKAGSITVSTDSGVSWTGVTTGTTSDLYCVSQSNVSVAMVTGTAATVLVTADGGHVWTKSSIVNIGSGSAKITTSTTLYYRSVVMLSNTRAFLVSTTGIVLATRNAGLTWSVSSSNLNYPLYSISAFNESVAVIGTSRSSTLFTSAVFRRTPGNEFSPAPTGQPTSYPTGRTNTGAAWTAVPLSGSDYKSVDVTWISATTVIMVGQYLANSGIILHSTTAGFAWDVTTFPNAMTGVSCKTISAITYCLAVSRIGEVFSSTNQGKNWTNSVANIPASIFGVSVGTNVAYTAGYDGTGACQIYKSLFPFNAWTLTNLCTGTYFLNNIKVLDGGRVIAVGGAGVVMMSSDRGSTWTTQTITTADFYSIASYNSTAVVGGSNSIIFITKNGGVSWAAIHSFPFPPMLVRYNTLSMVSKSVIYAAGSTGSIVYTKNGGRSWINDTLLAYKQGNPLYCLSMYSTSVGVAANGNGLAYVKFQESTFQPSLRPALKPTRSPLLTPVIRPTSYPTATIEAYMHIPVVQTMTHLPVTSVHSFNPPSFTNHNRSIFESVIGKLITTNSHLIDVNIFSTAGFYSAGNPTPGPTYQPTVLPSYSHQPSKLPTVKKMTNLIFNSRQLLQQQQQQHYRRSLLSALDNGVTFTYNITATIQYSVGQQPSLTPQQKYEQISTQLMDTTQCTTNMQKAYHNISTFSSLICQKPRIGNYTITYLHNTYKPTPAPTFLGLTKTNLIIIVVVVVVVVFAVGGYVVYRYFFSGGDESEEAGCTICGCLMAPFICLFACMFRWACCCCISCYKRMCGKGDDDDEEDDDDDDDDNKKKPSYGRQTSKIQRKEVEEEEEDDDEDDKKAKKSGWFSSMFKKKDDDDEEEEDEEPEEKVTKKATAIVPNSKQKKQTKYDDDDDDEEEKGKKAKKGWFGKKKKPADDDDDDDDD